MNKNVRNLSILLAVQVLLIAFFYTRGSATATFNPTQPLLSLNMDKVSKIEISETKKEGESEKVDTLVLDKKDGKWTLPGYFDFPVSEVKFSDFTKAIAEEKRSWPVGKTIGAAKKFKVTDADFERKIVFHEGEDKTHTVFLGDSPGFRKVYVRVDGDDATYTLKYNTSDLPSEAKKWIEKNYVKVEKNDIAKIDLGEVSLVNKDGTFQVPDLNETEASDNVKVGSIVTQVSLGYFDEVLGKKDSVAKGVEEFSFHVTLAKNNETLTYSFYKSERTKEKADDKKGEELVMTVSSLPYAFSIKSDKVATLRHLKRHDFVKEKSAQAPATDGSSEKKDAKAISGDNSPSEPASRPM